MKTFLMATPQEGTFTEDLFSILESSYQNLNIQTASNNGEMACMIKNDIYDLAIVNSDEDALLLSAEILASGVSMPIIACTQTNHIPSIKKLYKAGVSGVLNIGDGYNELLKAVADVLAKRIYISENVKQELLRTAIAVDDFTSNMEDAAFIQTDYFTNIKNTPPVTFIGGRITFFTECLN